MNFLNCYYNSSDTCTVSQFAVHRTINQKLGSILPSDLQRAIFNGIFSIGRMQLSGFILNENNPLGSSRLSKLREIFEEGKSLQLQFPAEDLGFRYYNDLKVYAI